MLLRLAGGIKLRGPADALESRAAIQRNWVILEEWNLRSLEWRNANPSLGKSGAEETLSAAFSTVGIGAEPGGGGMQGPILTWHILDCT